MSYQEEKSRNFAKYCYEGKIELVKKWMNNPNVDINYNKHAPLRNAIRRGHFEIAKLLVNHSQLKTDYEKDGELKGAMSIDGKTIGGVLNPFTTAMAYKNFEVLDLFINHSNHPFKVLRKENLDILIEMDDEEINEYFRKLPGFVDYAVGLGADYAALVSKDLKDIFFF